MFNYVPSLKFDQLKNTNKKGETKEMKERVLEARKIQKDRLKGTPYKVNSEIRGKDIFNLCKISEDAKEILENYFRMNNPSLRGYGKVIKVAQTIADLEFEDTIKREHIIEAITYRKDINGELV